MKIGNARDFWSGVMFIVVGLAFAVGARSYSYGASANPGPGYFPFWLGLLLAVLGGVVLMQALRAHHADGHPIGAVAWRPLLVVLAAVVVFGVALPRLGLVVAIPLLVLIASFADPHNRLIPTLVVAAALTAGSYLVFVRGLKLVLPVLPAGLG